MHKRKPKKEKISTQDSKETKCKSQISYVGKVNLGHIKARLKIEIGSGP
jgi:hypothetical protein